MPIMDGYQATREIRRMGENCKIVALTAKTMNASEVQQCKDAGMDDCLYKPISFAQLSRYFKSMPLETMTATRRFSAPM